MQNETTSHKGKQEETHAGRQARTRQWQPRGNKISERRTHHPTQAQHKMWGESGKLFKTWTDMDGQDLGNATTPSTKGSKKGHGDIGRQEETRPRKRHGLERETRVKAMGDKGRQDLRKADTTSNTGTHVGRRWTIREGKTSGKGTHQWKTIPNKTSGRWTHHPPQPHMWEDNRRQAKTRPWEAGHAIQRGKQEGR